MVTVTSSPGSAQPQTGTGMSRCSTAWSVNMAGSFDVGAGGHAGRT